MKFKFKFLCILCFVMVCSSCSFSTKAEYTDYLVNKYVLNNVVDYSEVLMAEHTYINTSGLTTYNSYFNLAESSVGFNYGNKKEDIKFDFILTKRDLTKISIKNIGYNYTIADSVSKITANYDGGDFEFYEITVFPNYWIRVRTHFQIEESKKELIFEYKSNGRNA